MVFHFSKEPGAQSILQAGRIERCWKTELDLSVSFPGWHKKIVAQRDLALQPCEYRYSHSCILVMQVILKESFIQILKGVFINA